MLFPLSHTLARDVRCGCDLYAFLSIPHSPRVAHFCICSGFHAILSHVPAFLSLGVQSHLRLLAPFRATCCMIETGSGTLFKEQMERGGQRRPQAVMYSQREGSFVLKESGAVVLEREERWGCD